MMHEAEARGFLAEDMAGFPCRFRCTYDSDDDSRGDSDDDFGYISHPSSHICGCGFAPVFGSNKDRCVCAFCLCDHICKEECWCGAYHRAYLASTGQHARIPLLGIKTEALAVAAEAAAWVAGFKFHFRG